MGKGNDQRSVYVIARDIEDELPDRVDTERAEDLECFRAYSFETRCALVVFS
jgi:hypothetical protein